MKNNSLVFILFAFLVIIINGCAGGEWRYSVPHEITRSQVTQHLPPEYAIEYLNTIKGNCYFEQSGIQLLKNGIKNGALAPYPYIHFFITRGTHPDLYKNDKYEWIAYGNSHLIMFDGDTSISRNKAGMTVAIARIGVAISEGRSACAIEYQNESKIMTALASLGVR